MRSKDGALDEEFSRKGFALGVFAKIIVLDPARLIKQVRGLPQKLPVLAGAIADRRQFGR